MSEPPFVGIALAEWGDHNRWIR